MDGWMDGLVCYYVSMTVVVVKEELSHEAQSSLISTVWDVPRWRDYNILHAPGEPRGPSGGGACWDCRWWEGGLEKSSTPAEPAATMTPWMEGRKEGRILKKEKCASLLLHIFFHFFLWSTFFSSWIGFFKELPWGHPAPFSVYYFRGRGASRPHHARRWLFISTRRSRERERGVKRKRHSDERGWNGKITAGEILAARGKQSSGDENWDIIERRRGSSGEWKCWTGVRRRGVSDSPAPAVLRYLCR